MTVINTNISALTAQNAQRSANNMMGLAMQRLSTGQRINSAKDDAAGLAISQKMTADVRGLAVAMRNAGDGISMAQTAESAMGEVTNMLQRMRELAVQSANGTLTGIDRQAVQAEVRQLIGEVDNIGVRTNFNGRRLLDGSAQNVRLQTGSRAGETVAFSLSSTRARDLGLGSSPALSASGAFEATAANLGANQALQAGDLVINGVTIGSSLSSDDSLSSGNKAASAVAKAAAINRATAQTGVRAVVGQTVMTGSAMTAAALTGTVTINGVTTASVATTTDAAESRRLVRDAINAISGQTGVRAVDTGDTNGGIRLEADDGRNIEVAVTTLTAAATGLKVGAQSGSFSLESTNGQPIEISSANSASARISRAGLAAGTFERGVSTVSTDARAVAVDAAGIRNLNNGDLSINGVAIRAAAAADDNVSSTVAASSSKSASAISIAAAINASSAQTGVSAVANDVTLTANTTATTLTGTGASVTINGVAITIEGLATTDTAQARREKVAAAINNFGGMTGVTASDNGLGGLDLTAADGRNLSVAIVAGGATAAELGLGGTTVKGSGSAYAIAATAATAETAYGTVRLESAKAIDVRAGSQAFAAASNFTSLGFEENSYGASAGGLRISDIDVSTADGATAALDAIDTALNSVNLDRANIGAVQNRLEAAVNNLSSNSTNLQASRSRIQDTDFATESTNLAKNQVLSQAAQAMLARANQSAQQVTQLLQ
ncbi:flagellin [Sandarakinorhabdus limnophila]|uniref:flagellin N-terminal helical domain-containing protein n=1 Tax=Sandarakinorhabdus limnophila TaxID=210512 RepID=UPI0026ED1EA3|nr:flagellin [Sandarakinorhabdus limnophila]MCM0032880.1 flagellin protein FlaA [Sandarakinorhabdus limnophila]